MGLIVSARLGKKFCTRSVRIKYAPGIAIKMSVCLCVNKLKNGSRDVLCSVDHHINIVACILAKFICSAESAKSRLHDSVATVGDAASGLV